MRAVLQRVSRARVTVEEEMRGEIGAGLMILLGVGARILLPLRLDGGEVREPASFRGPCGKDERSLLDVKGGALVVSSSRFTAMRAASGGRASLRPRLPSKPKPCMMNFVRRSASSV